MTETQQIEEHEYITIDGKEPGTNKSFFISKKFQVFAYSLAVLAGILIYLIIT